MAGPVGVPRSLWIGATLAFVAGFADAVTFVGADGVFCAHVTGNFVVLAADLARGTIGDQGLKLATFPLFVATVLAVTGLHRRLKLEPPRAARGLLVLQGLLIAAAAALALVPGSREPGATRVGIVALLVVAMGVQNALHRIHTKLGPMTTVMTGNVTQWLADAVTPSSAELRARRVQLGVIILAFAIGCAAGGTGVARLGFVVVLAPALATIAARFLVFP
jgi:uncharacterized membrane protein YoaK (UPF0700 family)